MSHSHNNCPQFCESFGFGFGLGFDFDFGYLCFLTSPLLISAPCLISDTSPFLRLLLFFSVFFWFFWLLLPLWHFNAIHKAPDCLLFGIMGPAANWELFLCMNCVKKLVIICSRPEHSENSNSNSN